MRLDIGRCSLVTRSLNRLGAHLAVPPARRPLPEAVRRLVALQKRAAAGIPLCRGRLLVCLLEILEDLLDGAVEAGQELLRVVPAAGCERVRGVPHAVDVVEHVSGDLLALCGLVGIAGRAGGLAG